MTWPFANNAKRVIPFLCGLPYKVVSFVSIDSRVSRLMIGRRTRVILIMVVLAGITTAT